MIKTGLVRRRRIGYCDLFVICDLLFDNFAQKLKNHLNSKCVRPAAGSSGNLSGGILYDSRFSGKKLLPDQIRLPWRSQ
jgi:hypothetical protein